MIDGALDEATHPIHRAYLINYTIRQGPIRLWQHVEHNTTNIYKEQAFILKFRLRELTSFLCSAAALAVCFEVRVAGLV